MEEKDILAYNIAYYRKKAGISQLELADKLMYSNKNISKWEKGETTPNVFVLKKIAEIFGIKLDDLVSPISITNEQEVDSQAKRANKRKVIIKYGFLGLANAILFAVACSVILCLTLCGVTGFNKWLMLLYIQPLCVLSVFIFIRCIYKRIDPFTLSLFGWLIAVCLHVSLLNVKNIAMIYIVAGSYQFLVIIIALIVNLKLVEKFANSVKRLRKNKTAQVSQDK